MFNFFRKIRYKLLNESRIMKFLLYSLGEILLVVIGILIALSVNNWKEDQKEQSITLKLLKNLKEEIIEDQKYFENVYKVEKELFLTSSIILFDLHSGNEVNKPESEIGKSFRYACFTPIIKYSDHAFSELTSSELLDRIGAENFKSLLMEYYGQIKFLNNYSDQNQIFITDLTNDLAKYHTIHPPGNENQRNISSFSGASEADFTASYDLINFRNEKSFNPRLYDMVDIHKDRLGGLEITNDLSKKIINIIDKELEEKH